MRRGGNDEKCVYPSVVMEISLSVTSLSRTFQPDEKDKSTPFVVCCVRPGVRELLRLFTE